jgi:TolB-like protein
MSGATTRQDLGTGARPRLDSWKEIATYLKRSVRTVRRWERQERLPVHRHVHGKQGTVYAFADEIDKWLDSRSVEEGREPLPVQHGPQPSAGPGSENGQRDHRTRPLVIAILPLRSLSRDPEQERFAEGLTEELIQETGYCCPRRLRVIALTSVMQYKQSSKSIGQIGQELGVDYILEGSIRRYGQRVRLTARVIAASDQAHIWADSYEVLLPPIYSLQQALARQVADSLSAALHTTTKRRRHRATVPSVAAHSAYIEGTSQRLSTDGEIKKCIEHLSLAIERDSKFAPSYAELALAYFRRLFSDYPPIVTLRRIDELALKALKLDSKLARGYTMLAAFQLFGAWNWPKADATSRQALKLNPSDAWAEVVRVAYHVVVRELPEAIEDLSRGRQLDPRSTERSMWFAILAYFARRYDLAIEGCQELLQRDSTLSLTHMVLGGCYSQMGDHALAISHCEKAREFGEGTVGEIASACSVYALAGERDSAERLLQELLAAQEQQYLRHIFLAQASVCLGKKQHTLDWLEKAYEQRDPLLVFLKADPRFDSLSGLARFRNLLRRIGLPGAVQRPAD